MVTWSHITPQSLALAQVPFPTKPVAVWVGFSAGGVTDNAVRALTAATEKSLGQRIIVVNKPGGGGAVMASQLVNEKPDGYTLGGNTDTPITKSPHLTNVSYDPFKDFRYICLIGKFDSVFAVSADSPFKKWEEVVDWAKKNPGQLMYGHVGPGTSLHLGMVKVAKKEGFTYKDIPFNGDAPMVSALLGGHVMVGGVSRVPVRTHVEAKTIRILLTFDKESIDYAPEVPTFEKMGYDFDPPMNLIVIFAPKRIPDHVAEILEKAFVDGLKKETFRTAAKIQGITLLAEPLIGKALFDYLRKWYVVYEGYIKEAGIYKIEKK